MSLDFLNPTTIRNLLQQGQQWGLILTKTLPSAATPPSLMLEAKQHEKNSSLRDEINNIINIGEIVYDDLPHDGEEEEEEIPCGYEEDYEESKRILLQPIHLTLKTSEILPENTKVVLKSYEIEPANHSTTRPIISFMNEHSSTQTLDITAGHSVDFKIKFTLPLNYIGSLNRLLLLDFQCYRQVNEFSNILVNFKIGVLLLGKIVHKAAHHSELLPNNTSASLLLSFKNNKFLSDWTRNQQNVGALSTEAAPFIPMSELLFFNSKCPVFFDEEKLWGALSCPPNAVTNISPYLHINLIGEQSPLFLQYLDHQKNNTLQKFLILYGLNQLNEVLLNQSLATLNPQSYLKTLQKLNHLEEMANHLDYYKYDIHFLSIRFLLYGSRDTADQSNNSNHNNHNHASSLNTFEDHFSKSYLFQCKVRVKGSNELRPKILTGDRIRFRPTLEDCQKFNIPMVELVGMIIHYTLATEETIIIVSVPKEFGDIIAGSNLSLSNIYSSDLPSVTKSLSEQSLQLWNSLRYHLRFIEDRSLISFTNYLLYYILPNHDYLLRCFFPSSKDIEHLRNQFRLSPPPTSHPPAPTSSLNKQQNKALREILFWCGLSRCNSAQWLPMPPFIIFGPAGTGKTSTVIETIIQITQQYPKKRILACAPSEAAADVIASRLVDRQMSTKVLHRFNWWQRLLTSVPAKLLPYCNQFQHLFEMHPLEQLLSYQVIVTTCQATGSWLSYEQQLLFDVIIVDEASQATEAEVFLPLCYTNPGGTMILAGDIHQLGPQTKFSLYQDCIPFFSLQERLLHLPYYSHCLPENLIPAAATSASLRGSGDPRTLIQPPPARNRHRNTQLTAPELTLGVFLNQNYRTHANILTISSELFYHRQLIACGDEKNVNQFSTWTYLKAHPSVPLLFFDVKGKHEHEMDSPSYYNDDEVAKIVEICQSIAQEKHVPSQQIGVIAAFRKQVLKIRQALRAVNLHSINVGGVEDFQGQEVAAIIISTVLTAPVTRFMTSKGSFGLMNDAKRFNVSITRGMALCAVVGCGEFLLLDPYWKHYISACSEHQRLDFIHERRGDHDGNESTDVTRDFFRTVDEVIQQIFADE